MGNDGNGEKSKITYFTDLNAWREAHKLVLMIYGATKEFPRSESFGLVSQMRRSAVSITSNIAEGFSRRSYKDKGKFYVTAQGSLTELQNQLLVAKDVGYLAADEHEKIFSQTVVSHKLINGLIKSSRKYE